jgi:hypothetical protein
MTRFGWIVLGVVLVVIAGAIGGWFLISAQLTKPAAPVSEATTTPQADLSSSSIYTNGTVGFSIVYPGADVVRETFSPWRANAVATGTPVVSITDSSGVVRVGVSHDAKELKACVKASASETIQADMRLGSTTFKAFVHDQLGTDNENRITSYRAIHENSCVALETMQPLTGGKVATSTALSDIASSFSFARP